VGGKKVWGGKAAQALAKPLEKF